jgi:hypothetical protein
MHCKGAILYNFLIDKHNLESKYVKINEGDKIRYLHLKRQNPFACSAFSFMTVVPTELDITNYIDLETQFEKSFVEPLRFITDKISMRIDDGYGVQGSLEEFFV